MNWREGTIDGVRVISVERHTDARGWLAELFRADEIPPDQMPVMGYISVTLPGMARGPHEHSEQSDRFGIVGPGIFIVKMWDRRIGSATHGAVMSLRAGEDNPVVIVIPPGVIHGYMNISDVGGVVINMADRLYRGPGRRGPVDEIRYENDADPAFRFP